MDILSVKQRFGIIGISPAMTLPLEGALRVAPTDLSVLITGESGVGKEFFPQIIHAYSARKHNKYIAVNCGALPEGTIDSELFGHEKGSFTGALDSRKGYFEEANGGTIFLDEVAELPLPTQARLLRVLQSGEFIRVGSSKIQKTNVRVVAATNVNLHDAIQNGQFREDLYYRLCTVPIFVPSLRERREDIYLLFRKFASDVAVRYQMPTIVLNEGAREVLENYSWPGNIRQLKNIAEQISALESSREITSEIISRYISVAPRSPILLGSGQKEISSDEREILYKVLFDLRRDVAELKQMVRDLSSGVYPMPQQSEIAGLLPSSNDYMPAIVPQANIYSPTEVVEEAHEVLTKEKAQKEAIIKALKNNNGRRRDAAKELFISERTLYRKIKELEIDDEY